MHNGSNKFQEYRTVSISTGNQETLILKCYDGIINCLNRVVTVLDSKKNNKESTFTIRKNNIEIINNNLIKAQKGLALLADALNNEAGEISSNLERLYDFMIRRLSNTNTRKDSDKVKEILTLVTDLKNAWVKAFTKLHHDHENGHHPPLKESNPLQPTVLNIVG